MLFTMELTLSPLSNPLSSISLGSQNTVYLFLSNILMISDININSGFIWIALFLLIIVVTQSLPNANMTVDNLLQKVETMFDNYYFNY